MGRSFSEVNLAAIEVSDNILIVCTPDRVGIRAVTESQRIFRELLKLPGDPLQYVLNHPAPYTLMAPEELEQALQARFVGTIPFGGDAPARAALEGRPIVTRWPSSVVSKAILSMAMRVEQQAREAFALAAR
jgi:pilus assembly protein CpaE